MYGVVRLTVAACVVALALAGTANAQQGATYEVVTTFDVGSGAPTSLLHTATGQLYGTTAGGPPLSGSGAGQTGTVFTLDTAGTRSVVKTFQTQGYIYPSDGRPGTPLFEGADGTIYGTTFGLADSLSYPGQIFSINTAGSFSTLARIYELEAGVIQARDGRVYGTTDGWIYDSIPATWTYGYVFRLNADNSTTELHRFSGPDGANPVAELVQIDDGSLYGTTRGGRFAVAPTQTSLSHGTVFRLDPNTGAFTNRHTFSGVDGSTPLGRLIQGSDGLIYGTTSAGGAANLGTVFSIDAAGTLTTLHHFSGPDGANPYAGVIQGQDGRLYGTTRNGGASGVGTVFALDVTSGLTTLHHLTPSEGAYPINELIQTDDGALYGTATGGGANDRGVVFRVRLGGVSTLEQFVEIVSRSSGKCLDISGASTNPGAPAIQWTCHGGANQQWRLESAGGGGYRIISRQSGHALDVAGAAVNDTAPIVQWLPHNGDNQIWTLQPAADGYVQIVARHSGKAIDVDGASTADGAAVIQYSTHDGANQQWLLRPSR